MELHFTGRGAAFNAKEGNTNAYFIENEKLFLVDCGETMFSYLRNENILSGIKEIYTLISHTHSDHCGSLGSVGLYCQFVLHTKLKIIVPHNEEYIASLDNLMKIFGNTENAYEFLYEEEIDGLFETFSSVRYELTLHDYMLTCYSFIFETPKGGVFYSADTRTTDNILHFIRTHAKIDRMYMEVTDLNVPNDIHLNIDALTAVIPPDMRKRIWMMHLRGDSCIEKIKEAGFYIITVENTGNTIV